MKKMRPNLRWIWILLVGLVAGEGIARFVFGLGNPPLLEAHPVFEYRYRPDQDVTRFGNRIRVNQYGMRSDSFPEKKPTPDQYRVMCFGDSLVEGGSRTGHEDLATTRLQTFLESALERDVVVGNVAAKSWGPGNWLGFAETYGFYDADVVVLFLSSHDAKDLPRHQALDPVTQPQTRPRSALVEGVRRYGGRLLPHRPKPALALTSEETEAVMQSCLQDITGFLTLARQQTEQVLVCILPERSEVEAGAHEEGALRIDEACRSVKIAPVSLLSIFREALEQGKDPYFNGDRLHPGPVGQQLIADFVGNILLVVTARGET